MKYRLSFEIVLILYMYSCIISMEATAMSYKRAVDIV